MKKFLTTLILISALTHSQIGHAQTTVPGSDGGGMGTMLLNMLVGTGMSYVNTSIIRCRGVTPDSVLAATGAITHLGGEIYTNITQANVNEKVISDSSNAEQAFATQIDQTHKLLKNLKTKYSIQKSAATLYGLGAGTALLGWYSLNEGKEQCANAAKSSIGSCQSNESVCKAASSTCQKGLTICEAYENCKRIAATTAAVGVGVAGQATCEAKKVACLEAKTSCGESKNKCEQGFNLIAKENGKSTFAIDHFSIEEESITKIKASKHKKIIGVKTVMELRREDPFNCVDSCESLATQLGKCNLELEKASGEGLRQIEGKENQREFSTFNSITLDSMLLLNDYGLARGCGNPEIGDYANNRKKASGKLDGVTGLFASAQDMTTSLGKNIINFAGGENNPERIEQIKRLENNTLSNSQYDKVIELCNKQGGTNCRMDVIDKHRSGVFGPSELIDELGKGMQPSELLKMRKELIAEGIDLEQKPLTDMSAGEFSASSKYTFTCADEARDICTAYGDMLSKSLNRCSEVLTPEQSQQKEEEGKKKKGGFFDFFTSCVETGHDFLFPRAEALTSGSLLMLALNVGPQLYGIWNAINATHMKSLDKYMATYNKRALIFGAASAMLGIMAYNTNKQIKEVEGNLKKLQQMQSQIGYQDGEYPPGQYPNDYGDGNSNQNTSNNDLKYDKIRIPGKTAKLPEKLPCATPNCMPVDKNLSNNLSPRMMRGLSSANSDKMKKAITDASRLGNDLQGKNKISGSTMGRVLDFGKHKKAIDGINKNLRRKINGQLKRMGKAPINFDQAHKKILNKMKRAAEAIYGDKELLENPSALQALPAKDDKKRRIDQSVYATSKPSMGGKRTANNGDSGIITPIDEEDYATMEDVKTKPGSSDINDPGRSLWLIISGRYIKTGVDRLLEEKEKIEAPLEKDK